MGRTSRLFGLVHRCIGLLHQRIDVGRVIGIDADAHAGGDRHLPVAELQRRRQGFRDAGRNPRRAIRIAIRQHDHELVATQTSEDVARPNFPAQPLRQFDQQLVAGRMSERIVDVLEMIEIEEHQRDAFPRGTAFDRLVDQLTQLRAVRQAGQHIVVGELGDLGPRLLALDRQRAEMDAGVDNALMPAARRAALPEIEGKGSDHAAILGLDRRGPACAQADFERPGLERLPAWIGVDVVRQHRFPEIGRGSARADVRSDRDAVKRAGIVLGEAGAAERMNQPVGVNVQ